jgi:AcrR family transcriptional regulator
MTKSKMSGEQRKADIAMAARGAFARTGFYGTSMREIARAANVSEALIYRHFSSKEELYKEIYFYIDSQIEIMGQYFRRYEASTQTLFRIIFALSSMIMSEMPGHRDDQKVFERLLVYSLLENTSFAKSVFEKYDRELTPLWLASFASAQQAGDMYEPLSDSVAKMWLSHHLIMAINFLHLSGESLFPYGGSKQELINGMVVFILRGTGLKDRVIRNHLELEDMEGIVRKIFGKADGGTRV